MGAVCPDRDGGDPGRGRAGIVVGGLSGGGAVSAFDEWEKANQRWLGEFDNPECRVLFNAGMSRAADIVHGHTTLQLGGYYTPTDGGKLEAAIRAEIKL